MFESGIALVNVFHADHVQVLPPHAIRASRHALASVGQTVVGSVAFADALPHAVRVILISEKPWRTGSHALGRRDASKPVGLSTYGPTDGSSSGVICKLGTGTTHHTFPDPICIRVPVFAILTRRADLNANVDIDYSSS